jgi:hypothetical protein
MPHRDHGVDVVTIVCAISNEPDAGIRELAERYVPAEPTERMSPAAHRAAAAVRQQAIAAEVARLRPLVEVEKQTAARLRDIDARQTRGDQARAICQARGPRRDNALPYRGVRNPDSMIAGCEAANICWDTYQRTGIVLSY